MIRKYGASNLTYLADADILVTIAKAVASVVDLKNPIIGIS
jgi:hypothetical protein